MDVWRLGSENAPRGQGTQLLSLGSDLYPFCQHGSLGALIGCLVRRQACNLLFYSFPGNFILLRM